MKIILVMPVRAEKGLSNCHQTSIPSQDSPKSFVGQKGRNSQRDSAGSAGSAPPPTRSDASVLSYNCSTIQFGVYDGRSRRLCQNMWRFFAAEKWRFNFWRPWWSIFASSSVASFSFMTIILKWLFYLSRIQWVIVYWIHTHFFLDVDFPSAETFYI